MPVMVVGGSSRGVGKTTLVCGLLAALPEFHWTAVKITSHAHGETAAPVWEEMIPGLKTDTARYLAAGARRAFLITAADAELSGLARELLTEIGPGANLIFESNRILDCAVPDLCLAVEGPFEPKPSFLRIAHRIDAMVMHAECDRMIEGAKPRFELADLGQIPAAMQRWLQARLVRS
ncbi:MAG: hypothetical protein WCC26_00450 [Terracidiphilus sp.]